MSINRRELVSGLAVATVAGAFPGLGFPQGSASGLRINPDRLRENLEGLSVYGRPEGGTFADGVTRDGFSDACVAGRNYAIQLMRGFGMEPHVDPASNIFGSRAGSDQSLKPILFGSHIDSVPSGGNFDGDLGSMSAIEVMHTLKEHGVTTRHPLQMVIWTDEENTGLGAFWTDGRQPLPWDYFPLARQSSAIRCSRGRRHIPVSAVLRSVHNESRSRLACVGKNGPSAV